MAIEHSVITDPYVHEPKGITSASSGEAYIANGSGSGAWEEVIKKSDASFSYASMKVEGNTSAMALTAVADTTLNTESQYVPITTTVVAGPITGTNLTFSTDKINVGKTATYELVLSVSHSLVSAMPANVAFAIHNGTSLIPFYGKETLSVSGGFATLTFTKTVQINSGASLKVYVASSATGNITIRDMELRVREVNTL